MYAYQVIQYGFTIKKKASANKYNYIYFKVKIDLLLIIVNLIYREKKIFMIFLLKE